MSEQKFYYIEPEDERLPVVGVFFGDDGVPVVQIDGEIAPLRVWLNDGPLWDGGDQ